LRISQTDSICRANQQSLGIQPTQQFCAVSTDILASQVAVMGTKTLNHRGRRGAQRKTFFLQAGLKSVKGNHAPGKGMGFAAFTFRPRTHRTVFCGFVLGFHVFGIPSGFFILTLP
jgi:hypothetical protein